MIVEASQSSLVRDTVEEAEYEKWVHWPVNWSAVFIGALASLVAVLIFGLIGIAIGAHQTGPEARLVDLKKLGLTALAFSVAAAFLSFAIGGWVAGKVAGILHSEPAILHGAVSWLVATPILVALAGLGAASLFGGWYAGLAGTPAWAASPALPFDKPEPLTSNSSAEEKGQYNARMDDYQQKVKAWRADSPKVMRNTALGAVTAVLLGLMGSVVGGWLASGEPMNFSHHRTRKNRSALQPQVRASF